MDSKAPPTLRIIYESFVTNSLLSYIFLQEYSVLWEIANFLATLQCYGLNIK